MEEKVDKQFLGKLGGKMMNSLTKLKLVLMSIYLKESLLLEYLQMDNK